jgi:hypothetical protein
MTEPNQGSGIWRFVGYTKGTSVLDNGCVAEPASDWSAKAKS